MRNKTMAPKRKAKKGTFSRLMKLLYEFYPKMLPVTIFCILFSAATAAIPDIFIQRVMAVIEKWTPSGDWPNFVTFQIYFLHRNILCHPP